MVLVLRRGRLTSINAKTNAKRSMDTNDSTLAKRAIIIHPQTHPTASARVKIFSSPIAEDRVGAPLLCLAVETHEWSAK